ncbi:MAG: flavoprotein [bacterium]
MNKAAKHIVLGVTGSIAAYKSAELVRLIRKRGWTVSVIMTEAATKFVGELTFRTLSRNPVGVGMFDSPEEWCPEHISLAERADAVLIAPCTANVIAKIAHGLADDLLGATVLAAAGPVIVAPAMNGRMWDNEATRANVRTIKSRGIHIVDVEAGELACGCEGRGRMASPEAIMNALARVLRQAR